MNISRYLSAKGGFEPPSCCFIVHYLYLSLLQRGAVDTWRPAFFIDLCDSIGRKNDLVGVDQYDLPSDYSRYTDSYLC